MELLKKTAAFIALSVGLAACSNNPAASKAETVDAPKAVVLGLPSAKGVFTLDLNKVDFSNLDEATKARLGTENSVRLILKDGSAISYINTGGEDSTMLMEGDIAVNRSSKAYEYLASVIDTGAEFSGQGLSRFKPRNANWANNTIPYYWTEGTYNEKQEQVVRAAIEHWNEQAGDYVKWEWNKDARNAVRFIVAKNGSCGWSYVGAIGGHQQLGVSCFNQHTVMHEMGHAAGLWHEHQRCDRDQFVSIPEGYLKDSVNFGKKCNISQYGDFDYDSIMNYGNPFVYAVKEVTGAFEGNPRNLGRLPELSAGDINALRISYMGEEEVLPEPAGGYVYTGTVQQRQRVAFPQDTPGGFFTVNYPSTIEATLTGPADTDFDLHLQAWNGRGWRYVRSSNGPTSSESIKYSAHSGSFRWVVNSHKGGGEYTVKSSH